MNHRCQITGNLCGTDTWGTYPCKCDSCQLWLVFELSRLQTPVTPKSKSEAEEKAQSVPWELETAWGDG